MESITLSGKHAETFKGMRLGQKVTFSIEGEIRDMGFSKAMEVPVRSGEKPKREHHVTIYITKLNGEAKKSVNDSSKKR